MNITFSGEFAISPATFGINFEATVDGQKVYCTVSTEALQDIDPSNTDEPMEQYRANRSSFEAIAEKKIRDGETHPISINSSDV